MAGDVLVYGVEAVNSYIMPGGMEHSIAYVSRTLSPTEQQYVQVEKEALSLIFGICKFHKYLYGLSFTLITRH